MNRSQQLAQELEAQMGSGKLLPGEKLPSVRTFAAAQGMSPTTVVEVYELLKARGLLEARARSGYFVANSPISPLMLPERRLTLLPSRPVTAEDPLQDLLAAGNNDRVFPFGAAVPRPAFYPAAAIKRLFNRTLRENPALLTAYRFAPGSETLRRTLARRYQRLGVKLNHEAVVTTAGAIDAISVALGAVAEPGATVGVETPTYPGIFHLVKSLGYRILEIPLHAQRGLTPEALAAAISKTRGGLKAVVCIPNFSNPLGTLVNDEDKLALVRLASREGVTLIEDDIYADLAFAAARPRPLKAFDRDDSVILCTSFSKTVCPTLRVGAVINGKAAGRLAALKYARGAGLSALGEEVLQRYLEHGQYERHLQGVRGEYQTLLARYTQLLLQNFPAGTRVSQPQGGFILWVELPHAIDGAALQQRALKRSISVAPGSIFSESGTHYRNFIRLNGAVPWTEASRKALTQLAALLREF